MFNNRLFWGVLIFLAGVLLLLDNLNILTVNVWGVVWPLAIILIGFQMLGGHLFRRKSSEEEALSIPLESAQAAEISINHGAGRIYIAPSAETGQLLNGVFTEGVVHEISRQGPSVRVKLRTPSEVVWAIPFVGATHGFEWNLNLTKEIPLSLDLHTGASENHLDLTDLRVDRLRIETGASSTRLLLPANAGFTRVQLESGAASVDMRVPDGVAAKIRVKSGISNVNIDAHRFPRMGDYYESSDYANSPNRVEIEAEMGVGSVTIH